ncbi:hypothetical protein AB3X52_09315 [Nocardioides sp. DS6]|uniref:Uncharacterized protein n=1 Tax=Nocardioides eburneus TaxID=3231482 RepID=A0ABV3SZK0_9ACTN
MVHLYCHLSPGEGTGLVAVDNLQTVVPLERVEPSPHGALYLRHHGGTTTTTTITTADTG